MKPYNMLTFKRITKKSSYEHNTCLQCIIETASVKNGGSNCKEIIISKYETRDITLKSHIADRHFHLNH